ATHGHLADVLGVEQAPDGLPDRRRHHGLGVLRQTIEPRRQVHRVAEHGVLAVHVAARLGRDDLAARDADVNAHLATELRRGAPSGAAWMAGPARTAPWGSLPCARGAPKPPSTASPMCLSTRPP